MGVGGRGERAVLLGKYCLSFRQMIRLSSFKKTWPLAALKLFTCSLLSVTVSPWPLRGLFATGQFATAEWPDYEESREYRTSSLFKFEDKRDFVCF